MKRLTTIILLLIAICSHAQRVDFSVVFVPEESGNNITRISNAGDYVCLPIVKRNSNSVSWSSNRILGISPDGTQLAYISNRNNATNIFLTDLNKQGGSVQRTKRQGVQDFTFSSDGKYICFSEVRGKECQLFQTDAKSGYVCRQITSGARDYSPVYSSDMKQVFFAREEKKGFSVWSYNIANNFLATYSLGLNPSPVSGESSYFCTRISAAGICEIWKVNYENGLEWFLVDEYENHRNFQQFTKNLNNFYKNTPAMWQRDFSWEGFWRRQENLLRLATRRCRRHGKHLVHGLQLLILIKYVFINIFINSKLLLL